MDAGTNSATSGKPGKYTWMTRQGVVMWLIQLRKCLKEVLVCVSHGTT